jgi:ribosomal protein L23
MRAINWTVSMGMAADKQSGTIEVEDDATDEEIEEAVREEVFNVVSWGWSE